MSRIIGQKNLLHKLHTQPVPHFFILWGDKGSGKYMVSKQIAEHNNFNYVKVENNVDGIRQLIELTTALSTSTLFYIKGDTLTIQAQNALLKLAEEPPAKAYIMIGVRNIDNLLATIRSRAKTLIMDNYSYNELEDIFDLYQIEDAPRDILCSVATTPGQMLDYMSNDFNGMYNYAVKVYKNILRVSTGNSFKIGNELAFKDKDKGYPVELFLELFKQVVINKQEFDSYVDHKMIEYTSIALKDMRIRGANKPLIFDIWVLNIRTLR